MTNLDQPLLVVDLKKGWSPESRAAAVEARRLKKKAVSERAGGGGRDEDQGIVKKAKVEDGSNGPTWKKGEYEALEADRVKGSLNAYNRKAAPDMKTLESQIKNRHGENYQIEPPTWAPPKLKSAIEAHNAAYKEYADFRKNSPQPRPENGVTTPEGAAWAVKHRDLISKVVDRGNKMHKTFKEIKKGAATAAKLPS